MKTLSVELKQYLITALWSSTGEDGEPLDNNYGLDDISEETLEQTEKDWSEFTEKVGNLLAGLDLTAVAHDFWLTRNHHGAGFWDGDYTKEIGKALTDISHTFGELSPYVGDDEKIYF